MRILFFAPFLVIAYYNQTLRSCLWLSLLCGFLIDLLSSQHRLGLFALNYCLTTLFLYQQKKHFFQDNPTTFPLMTFFFSVLSTSIHIALLMFFGKPLFLTSDFFTQDLIRLPLYDAFYAGIAYTFPYLLFPKKGKKQSYS